jgi:cysteine synthase
MQGWTPDFISKLTQDAVSQDLIDDIIPIRGADAMRLSRELACKEGIFVGISSGATLAGALQVCATAPKGSNVLCMLPDTGERYLSTPLFEDIPTTMSDEEIEISKSTTGYRFDLPTPTPPKAQSEVREQTPVTSDAKEFVSTTINSPDQPVVVFALEWCEFCWSIKKMFAECEIPYRSVDLDSVEYQDNDLGGKIRAALNEKTGCVTIPQVFVGGEFIGGCTEVFDAFKDLRIQKLLDQSGVTYNRSKVIDPNAFLPNWLHPR